ncbi:hypothetical protein ACSUZJ_05760 [Telluria sp. B2]
MKITEFFCIAVLAVGDLNADSPAPQGLQRDESMQMSLKKVVPEIHYQGRVYRIRYVERRTRIELDVKGKKTILHQIPKRFDPSLVGAEGFIGFLPEELQPYKGSGNLLYVSSIRTSGGNGGGQCGSGAEIFLNVLNVNAKIPRTQASVLIGSCEKSIELLDQDMSNDVLGAVAVGEGHLVLQFMSYEERSGYPIATLSNDLKNLRFR